MDDLAPPTPPGPAARPPREEPPSGLKIAAVLVGLIVACCLACVLFAAAYAWYLDIRSFR